jgi:hypothetical protein
MLWLWFWARFWAKLPFWWISPPFERSMRIVDSAWCNLIVEEGCCFIAPKPNRSSSWSKHYQLRASLSNVVCRYSMFSSTLSQSEGTMIAALLSIIFNGLTKGVTCLKFISHLIQWIHLMHLHWRFVDHQEAPHCGTNFHESVAPFAILVSHPWVFRDP